MRWRRYTFGSAWHVGVPLDRCWDFLTAPNQRWLDWWPRLRAIDIHRTSHLVGSRAICTWRSPIGYQLRTDLLVTDVSRHSCVELTTRGDLTGVAFVSFVELDGSAGTRIDVTWRVVTTRLWMNLSAPLLRPLFAWGHRSVMQDGERGLNSLLAGTR